MRPWIAWKKHWKNIPEENLIEPWKRASLNEQNVFLQTAMAVKSIHSSLGKNLPHIPFIEDAA